MNYRLILRKGAEVDLDEAYRWYEEKVSGLGAEFIFSMDRELEFIQGNPERYPVIYQNVRRALLHRFPYGVFFV
jgi:toxin ParE1/3/4